MNVYNPPLGSGFPYISGQIYPATFAASAGSAVAANRDYLLPFLLRAPLRISAVMHSRLTTNPGDIYTGIYDDTGALLTNCAVDSVNSAGIHTVSTSEVSLSTGRVYYFCANSSAAAICEYSQQLDTWAYEAGLPKIGTITGEGAGMYKARASAALLANLDLTGWTINSTSVYGGFVAA